MKNILLLGLVTVAVLIAACGTNSSTTGAVIKSASLGNNLTVTLSNTDGVLRNGDNDFIVSFKDASGKTVEVGAVGLNLHAADGNHARNEQRRIIYCYGHAGRLSGESEA